MNDELDTLRTHPLYLDPLEAHMEAGKAVLASGDLFVADFVFIAVLQRSLDLVLGVRSLLTERNFTCAVALARLQIDSLIRLAYMATLPDADEFALHVLSGEPLYKVKDAEGKALTDKRLQEYAQRNYPWVEELYEKASRFIHFSKEHIATSTQFGPDTPDAYNVVLSITMAPDRWSEALFDEFADAFAYITDRLLEITHGWGEHKVALAARRAEE